MLLALVFLLSDPAATQSPESPVPPASKIDVGSFVVIPVAPDYDQKVLTPLHTAQALQAKLAAEAAQQRARAIATTLAQAQADERARKADLAATAANIGSGGTNNYAWGNCTAWVASNIRVPDSMGDATSWSYGLLSSGWRSGPARVGAIGVSHVGTMGHVVFVVAVNDSGVLISEMNYEGLDIVDQRYTSSGEFDFFYK